MSSINNGKPILAQHVDHQSLN